MRNFNLLDGFLISWFLAYDDDTLNNGDDTLVSNSGDDDKPKFTQKQVNDLIATEKRKIEQKNAPIIKDLENYKKKATLTEKEKTDLEQRIESLKNEHLTESERKQAEIERINKENTAKLGDTEKERDSWKGRFESSTIQRDITDAATDKEIKAYRPSQLVQLLKDNSFLKEKVDSAGKPTGEYTTLVKFTTEKDGQPLTLELTPKEVMKRYKEDENYVNLFEFEGKGGPGLTGSGTKIGNVDVKTMSPAEYKKHREKFVGHK